jgi:hypothetical protein
MLLVAAFEILKLRLFHLPLFLQLEEEPDVMQSCKRYDLLKSVALSIYS